MLARLFTLPRLFRLGLAEIGMFIIFVIFVTYLCYASGSCMWMNNGQISSRVPAGRGTRRGYPCTPTHSSFAVTSATIGTFNVGWRQICFGKRANAKISSKDASKVSHCGTEWVVLFFSLSAPICRYFPNRPERRVTGRLDSGSVPTTAPVGGLRVWLGKCEERVVGKV